MEHEKYIRFDWAAKRMLRDKANFGVLEGLITVLLNEEVHIVELLESESNQDYNNDKFNRVDIKARNSKDEIIIVEIQLTNEVAFLKRLLYGVARTITEHIDLGDRYDHVKKVYSISILYCNLGKGNDFLYHGQTVFKGVHTGDTLQLNERELGSVTMKTPTEVFPEYFLIRVNEFNKVASSPLEEWLDYLRNAHIKDDTTAPGLQQAKAKLQYMQMSREERRAYEHHIDDLLRDNAALENAKEEGMEEGRKEGAQEKALDIARQLKQMGLKTDAIVKVTGLNEEQIATI